MTNRLELNWKLDGFVDEQRYYCSKTPIDVNNLPTPKAILDSTFRSYVDTDVLENHKYYIRISSIRSGFEKISNEVEISTGIIAFKHYRLNITANNGEQSFTAMQEIELALDEFGSDITNPSTPVVASTSYSGFEAAKLVDNNFSVESKSWISANNIFPHYIKISLDESHNVSILRIWAQAASDALNRAPKDFSVQGSSDGLVWADMQSFSNITNWKVGVPKVFNLTNGTHI